MADHGDAAELDALRHRLGQLIEQRATGGFSDDQAAEYALLLQREKKLLERRRAGRTFLASRPRVTLSMADGRSRGVTITRIGDEWVVRYNDTGELLGLFGERAAAVEWALGHMAGDVRVEPTDASPDGPRRNSA